MTAPYLCRCPACQAALKLKDDSLIGKRIKCPKCAGVVVVPGPGGAAPSAPTAPVAAPTASASQTTTSAAPAKTVPQGSAPLAGPIQKPPTARPDAQVSPVVQVPAVPIARKASAPVPQQPSPPPPAITDELEDDVLPGQYGGGMEEPNDDDESDLPVKRNKERARGRSGIITILALFLVVVYLGWAVVVKLNLIGEPPPEPLKFPPEFLNGQVSQEDVLALKNLLAKNQNDNSKPDRSRPVRTKPDIAKPDGNQTDNNKPVENKPEKTNAGTPLPYPDFLRSQGQKAMRQRADWRVNDENFFTSLAKANTDIPSEDIEIFTCEFNNEVATFAISPDCKWLACGDVTGMITLVDLETGQFKDVLKGHTARITALAFAPNGRSLASCSEDRTVRSWFLTMEPVKIANVTPLGDNVIPHCLAFSPDSKLLAVGATDPAGEAVRLFKANSGTRAATLPKIQAAVNSLAFRSDGKVLAALRGDKIISYFDPVSGQAYDRTEPANDAARVDFHLHDGTLFMAASQNAMGKFEVVHHDANKGMDHPLAVSFQTQEEGKMVQANVLLPLVRQKAASVTTHFTEIDLSSLAFSQGGQLLAANGGHRIKFWYVRDLQSYPLLLTMRVVGKNGWVRRVGTSFQLEFDNSIGDEVLEKLPVAPFISEVYLGNNEKITNKGLSNLKKFLNLRVLQLGGDPNIDDVGLKVLSDLPKLEILYLDRNPGITDAVGPHLANLQELKQVQLLQTNITGAVMDHLRNLSNLSVINLGGCAIGDPGDLKKLTKLTQLNLSGCGLTDAGMGQLAVLSTLEQLHLRDNPKVTDEGVKALKGLTKLTYLDLSMTGLGDQGLVHLKELTGLMQLHFNGTKVTDAGFQHLANLKAIFDLGLSNLDGFTGTGLKHLVHMENLTNLNLNETKVTDQGMAGVKDLKQLSSINLPSGLSDSGLEPLAGLPNLVSVDIGDMPKLTGPGLKHLKKVIGLNLAQTGVTDAGLVHIKDIKTLMYLILPAGISDAGLVHLRNLGELNTLHLNGIKVTDGGLKQLVDLKKLQHLVLNETKVSEKGIEELKKALPNLDVAKNP